MSRSERQKARRNERERERRERKRNSPEAISAAQQLAAQKREKFLQTPVVEAVNNVRCRLCGERTPDCSNRTKPCSKCGQNVAICAEAAHQKNIFCRAATVARAASEKGLVRSPGDGLAPMLDEARIPYELHPTKITNWSGKGLVIQDEAWVQPEILAIVQADRPLTERMQALRRFAAWAQTG